MQTVECIPMIGAPVAGGSTLQRLMTGEGYDKYEDYAKPEPRRSF